MIKSEDKMVIQLIDDSKAYRYLIKSYLKLKLGTNFTLIEDELASKSIHTFSDSKPDCVLLDYRLPDNDGFYVLKNLRDIDPQTPIIVLTNEGDELVAAKFLKEGANNYLPKKGLGPNALYDTILNSIKDLDASTEDTLETEDTLSVLSHEIRSPLNTIVMAADLLKNSNGEYDSKECIEAISQSAKHLLKISSNILNFSQISSGKYQLNLFPGSLVEHIKQIMSYLGISLKSDDVYLDYSFKGGFPPYIMADFFALKQILINLITNAFKYTPKGYINVSVNLLEKHDKTIRVLFEVEDTGIGIPEDQVQDIFKKYTQVCPGIARKEGVGLGLTICKSLVNSLGGEIRVQSQVNKGSKFSFILDFIILDAYTEDRN